MKKLIASVFFLNLLFLHIYPQQVTDIDGNTYNTVVINNQTWLKENLNVSRYRNGDSITRINDDNQWQNNTSEAYTVFDNNDDNCKIYGKLYNWHAVVDPRLICPEDWHVPSDAEWTILVNYLGGSSLAGGKMKEAGYEHWQSPNTGADNSSGFTALPAGIRAFNSDFYQLGELTGWWSSTEYDIENAWIRDVFFDSSTLNHSLGKLVGFSCRCIKDETSNNTSIEKKLFEIYPNPSSKLISINGNYSKNIHFVITNNMGVICFSDNLNEGHNFDISFLPESIYFIHFISENRIINSEKLIVIR